MGNGKEFKLNKDKILNHSGKTFNPKNEVESWKFFFSQRQQAGFSSSSKAVLICVLTSPRNSHVFTEVSLWKRGSLLTPYGKEYKVLKCFVS